MTEMERFRDIGRSKINISLARLWKAVLLLKGITSSGMPDLPQSVTVFEMCVEHYCSDSAYPSKIN